MYVCNVPIVQNLFKTLPKVTSHTLERLSMTFTADDKRQRLPLIFYSFLVIIK